MTKTCGTHKKEYTYTCPLCEIELSFTGEAELIPYFRNGLKANGRKGHTHATKAAYEKGLKYSD